MGKVFQVEASYVTTVSGTVALPDGRDWETDVKGYYVKWNEIHIEFKDGSEYSAVIDRNIDEAEIDTKRPSSTVIYSTDEDEDRLEEVDSILD